MRKILKFYLHFKKHKIVILRVVKIVAILISILFIYFQFYIPAVVMLVLCLNKELESFPSFLNIKNALIKDQKTVNYHWDNDRDLILILRAVRFGYLLSTLLFSKFVYDCYKVDLTIYNLEAIGFEEWTIWAAIGILVLSRLTVTFMSVQIAFCRNLPTIFPLMYSTKILGMEALKIGVGVSFGLVALSGMPFIAP